MDDPLELATRRRLYALVKDYPGIHVREAARQLETSLALVEYHLALLREHRLVNVSREDGYARLFATDAPAPRAGEREQVGLLRQRLPLRITLSLLDDGPAKHKDLAESLGLGKSTLSFHLRKLEAAGLVARDAQGRFAAKDAPRVLRLLLAYPPTRDLRQAFADVWLSLYGDE
ncbi:MAG TPA: ArsR family transcriptional regulator [Candidatus Thermoplasmatota archaeon]|nr:ArsR family transcriptional regulator [Candidatus Thermoplasmatota archaeon]